MPDQINENIGGYPHYPIRGLVSASHSVFSKVRYMLFLTAYFDESGDVSKNVNSFDQNFTDMAGFVAPASVWEALQVDWLEVVNRPEFALKEYFHMKHFTQGKGQFEGWSKTRKDDLYQSLIAVIVKHEVIPVGCIVSTKAYRSLTRAQRGMFRSPYVTCFQQAVHAAAIHAGGLEPERVGCVFAKQVAHGTVQSKPNDKAANRGNAENLYWAMKEHPEIGHMLGTYSVDTPQQSIPLQVADILAYELTKEFETVLDGAKREMRMSLEELLKAGGQKPLVKFLDRLGLLRIARDSFFPDQTGCQELNDYDLGQIAGRFTAQTLLYERRRIKPPRLYFPAWQAKAVDDKWGKL